MPPNHYSVSLLGTGRGQVMYMSIALENLNILARN